jgi:dihydrodipicolinate synthase/N-acetylneuraminate lyase
LNRTKGTDFKVLMGKEHLLSKAFRAGAAGLVISFINAFPEPFVELVRHARESDWDAVERCQVIADSIIDEFLKRRKSVYFSALMLYLENELTKQGVRIKLY